MVFAFSSDNNYSIQLKIILMSLCITNDLSNSTVILIDLGLNEQLKSEIFDMLKSYGACVRFLTIDNLLRGRKLVVDKSMPIAAYSRLFLCNIDDIDKVIYMDCDAVVKGNLKELWELDLEQNLVAGVLDNMNPSEKELIGFEQSDDYINSGFLLMNLKQMRNENWIDQVFEVIRKYNGSVPKHDQGVINILTKTRKVLLPPKYNAMPQYLFNRAIDMKPLFNMNAVYTENDFYEAKNFPVFIHSTCFYDYRIWDRKTKNPYKAYYNKIKNMAGIDLEYVSDVSHNIPMEIARFFIIHDLIALFVIIRKIFVKLRNGNK